MPADESLGFFDHNELLAAIPEATRTRDFPYRVVVTIEQDRKPLTCKVIPDRLCAIKINSVGKHLHFALEIDRGNESVSTRSKKITKKATWRNKITAYYHASRQGKFRETWGFEGMRVLTVTTSDARIDNMLRCQEEITHGPVAGLISVLDTRAHRSAWNSGPGLAHQQRRSSHPGAAVTHSIKS